MKRTKLKSELAKHACFSSELKLRILNLLCYFPMMAIDLQQVLNEYGLSAIREELVEFSEAGIIPPANNQFGRKMIYYYTDLESKKFIRKVFDLFEFKKDLRLKKSKDDRDKFEKDKDKVISAIVTFQEKWGKRKLSLLLHPYNKKKLREGIPYNAIRLLRLKAERESVFRTDKSLKEIARKKLEVLLKPGRAEVRKINYRNKRERNIVRRKKVVRQE